MRKINDGLTTKQRWSLRHGHIKRLGRTERQGRCPFRTALDWLRSASMTNSDACVEWPWACSNKGYGAIEVNGVLTSTHRMAWMLAGNSIAPNLVVMHSCDNPKCINLKHLRLGTHKDNNQDMAAKERNHAGEDHYRAKLTADQVREIRTLRNHTSVELGLRYGVSPSTIKNIRRGQTWKRL